MQAPGCPCGNEKNYSECCGIFISGEKVAETPEELMRSRYTAYSQANIEYIIHTMKSPAADNYDAESALAWAKKVNWLGLKVIKSHQEEDEGMVEFFVSYHSDNKRSILYEVSVFQRENGRWFYVDGKQPKIGRNDLCLCGSHKKYKKCCG